MLKRKISLLFVITIIASLAAKKDKDSVLDSINQRVAYIAKEIGALASSSCCISITQEMVTASGGTYIIPSSGSYCLAGDINGTIAFGANSVSLNLNSHILNAQGAANAIMVNGQQSIIVYGGSITNAASAGISLTNANSVAISQVDIYGMPLNSIQATGSTNVYISNANFFNNNSGETALNFTSCTNVGVDSCAMSGFLTTLGAIVQFESCNLVSMGNVSVFSCTKSLAASNVENSISASFIHADSCNDITFENVSVNNNTIANPAGVVTKWTNMLGFTSCNNCMMDFCQTNNNIDVNGLGNNTVTNLAIDIGVMIWRSTNFIVNRQQVNNNTAPVPLCTLLGIYIPDSTSLEFTGCQINNNFVASTPFNTAVPIFSGFSGIFARPEAVLAIGNSVIRNCQVNNNIVADGGSGRQQGPGNKLCRVLGIQIGGPVLIDSCQCNQNSIGTSGVNQKVGGIGVNVSVGNESTIGDILISNCTADNNTGGLWARGIGVTTGTSANGHEFDVRVINCSGSGNNGYGLYLGDDDTPLPVVIRNIEIINCVFERNSNANQDAAGIAMTTEPNTTIINNVLVQGCQIYDTTSTATGPSLHGITGAFGIRAQNIANLVVADTNVYNTTASTGQGNGIQLGNCSNCKIIRSQFHSNQNDGISLGGLVTAGTPPVLSNGSVTDVAIMDCVAMANNNGFNFISTSTVTDCLVQDNNALSNTTNGFWYQPGTLSTVFIGNESQFNGANNYLINGGVINEQSLSVSTGTLTALNGTNAALGSRFTNLTIVP